ncbi:MAG TPA: hypothetical protein VK866_17285, partial [Acidimicrobiales bacterium]|nr:hypothetical protein [Acidimicrobiales bacterium]
WLVAGHAERAARCRRRAGDDVGPTPPSRPASSPRRGSVDPEGRAPRRSAAPWWVVALAAVGVVSLVVAVAIVVVGGRDASTTVTAEQVPVTTPPATTAPAPEPGPTSDVGAVEPVADPPVLLDERFDAPDATLLWTDDFGWGGGVQVTPDDRIVIGDDRVFTVTLRWDGLENLGFPRRPGETPEQTEQRCVDSIPSLGGPGGSATTEPVFHLGTSPDPAAYTVDRGSVTGPVLGGQPISVGQISYRISSSVLACSSEPHPRDPDRLVSIAQRIQADPVEMAGILPTSVAPGTYYLVPIWRVGRESGGPFTAAGSLVPVEVTAEGGLFDEDGAEASIADEGAAPAEVPTGDLARPLGTDQPFESPGATTVWRDRTWGFAATVAPDEIVAVDGAIAFEMAWDVRTNPGYPRLPDEDPADTRERCEATAAEMEPWQSGGTFTARFYLGTSPDPDDYRLDRGAVTGPVTNSAGIDVAVLPIIYPEGFTIEGCTATPHLAEPNRLITIAWRGRSEPVAVRSLLPDGLAPGTYYLVPVWTEVPASGGPFTGTGRLVPVVVP